MTPAKALPFPAFATFLRLGRVSNLPTVWTNVLAAAVLAGADPFTGESILVMLAMTLYYIGGMYLNDAFDYRLDAIERPERPIPSGAISRQWVFAAGFALLAMGLALMIQRGPPAGLVGLALAAAIVLYDIHHKGNPLSPIVMGSCRALVYVGTGLALSQHISILVLVGALGVLTHVAGLTYAAREERLDRIERLWPLILLALPLLLSGAALTAGAIGAGAWGVLVTVEAFAVATLMRRGAPGRVRRAVATLIAAISLVDAAFAGAAAAPLAVLLCACGFPLTLLAQRAIPGT